MQDSTREVNQLIEQRRYQQLKQQRLLAEPEPAAPALPQSAQCLPIAGVYLQGVTLLSPTDLSALSALPENCISSNDINRLTRELTRALCAKGYITARVQIVRPNSQGELGLSVTEGFIEKIEGGNRWVNSRLLFPGLEGKPLKLTELDQGLIRPTVCNRIPPSWIYCPAAGLAVRSFVCAINMPSPADYRRHG